jgi:hypothetical protein
MAELGCQAMLGCICNYHLMCQLLAQEHEVMELNRLTVHVP